MRMIPLRLWALAVLSAALQLLPFPLAGSVPQWRRLFCWFCLVPLLLALLGKDSHGNPLKPRQTLLLGYACGFCWYMGNCYWIYQTMHLYGGIPKPASFGILVLFSLYVGLYHALFGWIFGLLRRSFAPGMLLILTPFFWVAVELARDQITGFPWDLLGYTQVDNLFLTKLAPWTGVMGLSLLVAFINALLAMGWAGKARSIKIACSTAAVAFVLLAVSVPDRRPQYHRPHLSDHALLLQENISVGAERTGPPESRQQMLDSFDHLSQFPAVNPSAASPNLVIWPEAPADFIDSDPGFRQSMSSLASTMHASVIVNDIGFASRNPDGRYSLHNSASFFQPDGTYAGHYDKMHLVPFGEYTPYKPLFFFVGHLLDDLPFVPGEQRTLFQSQGKTYGTFICYESIFGDEIRQLANTGSQVLINISDDGWYGDSSAPWEHLDMVRMRAIENDRWVLRATNTGITASIDPQGEIVDQLPRHSRSSLVVGFQYLDTVTFYTRHGDWIGWLCALFSLAAIAAARFTRPQQVH